MGVGASEHRREQKGGRRQSSTSLALDCKKMDTSSYLPEDIVFKILTLLPARFLLDRGRFVCKTWANIIRDPKFIKSHTLAQLDQINEDEIEAAEIERMLVGNHILARCSGIFLLQSNSNDKHLSVLNPVTRQITELPRLPYKWWRSCVGYVPATGEIKVICHVPQNLCVLTVGHNMAWRMIDFAVTLPHNTCKALFVSLDGVLFYWYARYREVKIKLYAIDLANESIHHVNFPDLWADILVSTGKHVMVPRNGHTILEPMTTAWKLKDFAKSEWEECVIPEMRRRRLFRPLFYDHMVHVNTLLSW